MEYIIRGNRIHTVSVYPTDPTWNTEDCARFRTLRARYPTTSTELLQCIVWKQKVPGLLYPHEVESSFPQK
jgi:hypothetical protein